MIKICSLEFLNRDFFETDVMLEDGSVLCKTGEKITPNMLLSLYFRDIYVAKWPLDVEEFIESTQRESSNRVSSSASNSSEPVPASTQGQNFNADTGIATMGNPVEAVMEEVRPFEKITEEVVIDEELQFDEEEAKTVVAFAVGLGKELGMSGDKLKDLEQAAYYHKIGRTKFKQSDLAEKGFERIQAEESYNILSKKMKVNEKIANAVRFYLRKYDPASFKLNKNNPSDFPYADIIAIASYYNKLLSKNYTKNKALEKMLQLGGNRFNIFALHKFIYITRKSKDAVE